MIVTSCNADFHPARLERYLIMADQAGSRPVIVLTKADTTADIGDFQSKAEALQRDLPVIALTGRSTDAVVSYDAQGRHTTTARSLHAVQGGGWVIDTPGIRTLYVSDITDGIDTLFAEITELAPLCRFRDCTHTHEPGCAVRDAIAKGEVDADRLERWRSLSAENSSRTLVLSGPRGNKTIEKKR